jgi:hypothetical protein
VLATFDEDELPDAATASMEVDLAYFDDPTEDKADAVDGAIGELPIPRIERCVRTRGQRADCGAPGELAWPRGPWSNQSTGRALAVFLEPHDCVVSKLVAYREKDFAFAAAMLESGLIDPTILARRIDRLPAEPGSASAEEAAFMVEGLGRTTSTRLISPTTSDRRPSSSGLLRCDQKCGGPSMPSTRQREHP